MRRLSMPCQFLDREQFESLLRRTLTEGESGRSTTLRLFERLKDMDAVDAMVEYVDARIDDAETYSDVGRLIREYFDGVFDDLLGDAGNTLAYGGMGASRIVFVGADGVALKFLYAGDSAQMRNEIDASLRFPELRCFPRMFDYSPDMRSSAVECCMKATSSDFSAIYGEPFFAVYDAVVGRASPEYGWLQDAVDRGEGPEWRSLRDLRDFMKTRRLIDVDEVGNWGIALRDGRKVPVVVDFGL